MNSAIAQKAVPEDAKEHFKYGNYIDALKVYVKLMDKDPKNADYPYKAGLCILFTERDKTNAIKYLEKAAERKSDPDVMFYLGKAYHYDLKLDEALDAFNKYIAEGQGTKIHEVDREMQMVKNAKKMLQSPIDVTFEKFFSKNYYFLISGSVFDSKFKGSDGIERNTAFNQNYTLNALAGIELHLGQSNKHTLNLNGKWNMTGGNRIKPIDLEASKLAGSTRYTTEIYVDQYKNYSRADVEITYRQNRKKLTHEWSLEIQNILNQKNIFREIYNKKNEEIVTQYQLKFQPMFFYRISF